VATEREMSVEDFIAECYSVELNRITVKCGQDEDLFNINNAFLGYKPLLIHKAFISWVGGKETIYLLSYTSNAIYCNLMQDMYQIGIKRGGELCKHHFFTFMKQLPQWQKDDLMVNCRNF
jgi:hypothetical protein